MKLGMVAHARDSGSLEAKTRSMGDIAKHEASLEDTVRLCIYKENKDYENVHLC